MSGWFLQSSLQPFSPPALQRPKVRLLDPLTEIECSRSPFARQRGLKLSLSPQPGQRSWRLTSPLPVHLLLARSVIALPAPFPGEVTFHRTLRHGARTTRYLRFGALVFASYLASAPLWGFRPSSSTLASGVALRRHMRETKSLAKRFTGKSRPISLHSPQPLLEFCSRLRIIVPGPLRPFRLTVPPSLSFSVNDFKPF